MELVAPIFCYCINNPAHSITVFSIKCASNNLKILNSFYLKIRYCRNTTESIIHRNPIYHIANFISSTTSKMSSNNPGLHVDNRTKIFDRENFNFFRRNIFNGAGLIFFATEFAGIYNNLLPFDNTLF